jgi:quercetin dioxygenase-like cupin family protein
MEPATGAREFRILADPAAGLRTATHFVGYIPVGRAPDHFHYYDEVIHVLDGEGVMHAGALERPLSAGSSIQLPAQVVHCLENTGDAPMRVVAVFRPAGSPAAAFYPDGTPATYGVGEPKLASMST